MTATETETETTYTAVETATAFLSRGRELSGLDEWGWAEVERNLTLLGDGDALPGGIVAKRGNVYLCTVGYPDGEREDGSPFWAPRPENWRLCAAVNQSQKTSGERLRTAFSGGVYLYPGIPDEVFLELWEATGGCFPMVRQVLGERRLFHKASF